MKRLNYRSTSFYPYDDVDESEPERERERERDFDFDRDRDDAAAAWPRLRPWLIVEFQLGFFIWKGFKKKKETINLGLGNAGA